MEKNRGQITILVTLLSLLGLTVALSLVSKTLSDIRQVAYVDAGTRAFAGAEAGLQYALKNTVWTSIPDTQTNCNTAPVNDITSTLSLTGLKSTAGLTYKVCLMSQSSQVLNALNVARDDVVQFVVGGDPASLTGDTNLKYLDVNWTGSASLEIIVIDKNFSSGNYSLRRYAYNPYGSILSNGFAIALTAVGNCSAVANVCQCYTGVNDSSTGIGSFCYRPDCTLVGTTRAQVIRIKPLFQSASLNVCGRDSSLVSYSIPGSAANYGIIVTATAANGTVRRLQTSRAAGSSGLPAVFDSVFFSFDNISK